MATPEQVEGLLTRMRKMSAADLSVLAACTQTPESGMTTAPDSPNEVLWSEMVALGWMTVKDDELELTEGFLFPMKIYNIRPEGLEPISNLLAALQNKPGN